MHLVHDTKKSALFITILNNGKVNCKTTMPNMNVHVAQNFIKNLTKQDFIDILNTNMEIL